MIIYGNPGSGYNHKTEQPAYIEPEELEVEKLKSVKYRKSVRIDGKVYSSMAKASVECGMSVSTIRRYACIRPYKGHKIEWV